MPVRTEPDLSTAESRSPSTSNDGTPQPSTRAGRHSLLNEQNPHPDSPANFSPRRRLLYVVTVPVSAWILLRGQLSYMRELGYDVHLLSSPGEELAATGRREGITIHAVRIEREVSIVRDLDALWRIWQLVRRLRPDIVNVSTAKAGLLGGLAARLARVPVRIHVMRGLRSETARGMKRLLLRLSESVAFSCAHCVVCVSSSLLEKARDLRLLSPARAIVLGPGSSNGVVAERFLPTPELLAEARALRARLSIPECSPVIGYIGRFTNDKGIPELIRAFQQLTAVFGDLRLLLVGDFEIGDPLPADIRRSIRSTPGIVRTGFVAETAAYYHVMDIAALPTRREGFPNVPLEAAAAGKPVVTSDATGAADSVVHRVTGLVVPVGDVAGLAAALGRLIEDPVLASRLGRAGQERVLRDFKPERIWSELARLYDRYAGPRPMSVIGARLPERT